MAATSLCELQGDDDNFGDRISKLPDEILVCILSRLPNNEAGRSSVLSCRWRNLWKLTTILNFEASPEVARSKYVSWVNKVLRLHECPTVEEFRIRFELDASDGSHIDEWMKLMIVKRAKKIELDLTFRSGKVLYSPSPDCYQFIKSPSNLSNIACLRSLSLVSVNVGGELVEYFLSNCPHLESLSIACSHHLLRLQVAGPSLPLRYLKIHICRSLECIVLSAPNLVTFEYFGHQIEFVIGNNPLLTEVQLLEGCTMPGRLLSVTSSLSLFSSCFSRLETLCLSMPSECGSHMPQTGELRNLKHLALAIELRHDTRLLDFTRFIVAAPSLARLVLLFTVSAPTEDVIEAPVIQPHEFLKEVEILWKCCNWQYGDWRCFEIARYLAKVAINLEEMVVYMRSPLSSVMEDFEEIVQTVNMRNHTEWLKDALPPKAKLIVR